MTRTSATGAATGGARLLQEPSCPRAISPRWDPSARGDWCLCLSCRQKTRRCDDGKKLGGVNHCKSSLHCRLAKFRGLMIVVYYGAVIGRETQFFLYVLSYNFQAMGSF